LATELPPARSRSVTLPAKKRAGSAPARDRSAPSSLSDLARDFLFDI
jgi:hypothetical protein